MFLCYHFFADFRVLIRASLLAADRERVRGADKTKFHGFPTRTGSSRV